MRSATPQKISVVVPVHNEQDNIQPLAERIMTAVSVLSNYRFEILFVDDGSTDKTLKEIEKQIAAGLPIGYIKFSRNFGHQSALEAGLIMADGDAIITMDGDLQHPPEEIRRILEAYESGAEVVQMQRKNVKDDFKGLLSVSFYTFFERISDAPLVPNAADFRLVSRRVAEEIKRVPGKGKLLRAVIPAIGYRQVHLEYLQDERKFGQPSYSFSASYELAIHTIFKFSRFPAHFTTFSGIVLLIAGILFYLLHALSLLPNNRHTFFVPLFLMLSGCVFLAGGIICWYLYFILEQVRHDPTYIIEEAVSSSVKPE